MSKYLRTPLRENLYPPGVATPLGMYGIEVELEGDLGPASTRFWRTEVDHSLRGGVEFVFKEPLKRPQVTKALTQLQEIIDNSIVSLSIRCSTHIHVNVLDKTPLEIYEAMFRFYLLESLLVSTQPENRQGNLFCLRMQDARDIALRIRQSMLNGSYLLDHSTDHKYAAMNLSSLNVFGSLEFRFLPAFKDTREIERWVDIFGGIVNPTTTRDFWKDFEDLPPEQFLAHHLPHDKYIIQKFKGDLLGTLLTNYSIIKSLQRQLRIKHPPFDNRDPEE